MLMKRLDKNHTTHTFSWSWVFGVWCVASLLQVLGGVDPVLAQATKDPIISLQVSGLDATEPWTFGLRILFMLTMLTLAPALLMLVTSFTRVVIVLGLLRQALGTLHAPPNQVMIGLALFLTLFIMMPVWEKVQSEALNPFLENQVTQEVAMQRAIDPIREFMLKQVREKDLDLFMNMGKLPDPQTAKDVPIHALVPAFVTSELRTAFQIGFLIYVPFLVIDMIVASTLMSMGMMMLPPIMISLPFKLVLFVLADGWLLIVGSLMNSFH
ncbi:MAG: flagellar type III secretion system pore protein FliP [Nitrospirota bacterium]|nr:flagellar type III secretion system pore protein FliP [Nitrospirota bacterium]